ncbi:hypothetical protein JB92DRAFT_2893089 [Gautieria morchelliformis]|nr:hypothetical protein JB92DRAFT_2893089 [Gautieria morchelliformis]
MTKHSKNNTASSIFSYAEYKKLDYGTKRQRLGNESMRQFDACSLCLQRAREPLSCASGHLFCKECVYTDLLAQKKDIRRQKERFEALHQEEEEEKERVKEAARQRVLHDFERGQLGLGIGHHLNKQAKDGGADANGPRGTKRKFDFDLDKAEVMARQAEEDALRQIELEQAESRKSKLPDFWLPSLTPTAGAGPLKDLKLGTLCRAATPAHPLALKNLIPVSFSALENGNSDAKSDVSNCICPSCKKALSNNLLLFLMKPCSHVVCKTCTDSLVRSARQCVVCDHKLGNGDIVELKREGTGYAGGGIAETSKKGVAFQG